MKNQKSKLAVEKLAQQSLWASLIVPNSNRRVFIYIYKCLCERRTVYIYKTIDTT